MLPPVSFRPLSGSYISQLNSHICSLNVCGLFPSPIGELHFSMLQLMLHHRNTQSFRPLSGSYISQYFISCVCLLFIFVSVPYRGATFLNTGYSWNWKSGIYCFRPLSGSYISQYFLQICKEHGLQSFRPLSGSYISQWSVTNRFDEFSRVSVPYRGATFLNCFRHILVFRRLNVSVPYRGATFLNKNLQSSKLMSMKFPSPIGELHFSIK